MDRHLHRQMAVSTCFIREICAIFSFNSASFVFARRRQRFAGAVPGVKPCRNVRISVSENPHCDASWISARRSRIAGS